MATRPARRISRTAGPARPAGSEEDLDRARDLGIDTCGRIAEFWGFTRTMGRAFGLLYLSPEPLTQVEIQRRLRISAGNASMTLAALMRWGVVQKVWVRGQRREHYRARDRLLEDDLRRAERARAARDLAPPSSR